MMRDLTTDAGASLPLAADEVHVWFAQPATITAPELLSTYQQWLSPAEQQRQQKFRFAEHRHQYLIAHALLRITLSRYAPRAPAAWMFEANSYGKPALVAAQYAECNLHFNLSHTADLIACAVVRGQEIGVDVEQIRSSLDTAELAARILTAIEQQAFFSLDTDAQLVRFFDYWVLKEAYIKARGMGLSLPLDEFAWTFTATGLQLDCSDQVPDDTKYWSAWLVAPTSQHRGAVVVRQQERPFQLRCWQTVPLYSGWELGCQILQQSVG